MAKRNHARRCRDVRRLQRAARAAAARLAPIHGEGEVGTLRLCAATRSSDYGRRIADAVVGCGAGDQASLARLYDATIPWIYPLAIRATPDGRQAQALVVGIYRDLWRDSGSFDPDETCAVAWVLRATSRHLAAGQSVSRRR